MSSEPSLQTILEHQSTHLPEQDLREELDELVRRWHKSDNPAEAIPLMPLLRRKSQQYLEQTGKHYYWSWSQYDGR